VSVWVKVTAIDVAALQAHSRNRPTALDDDKKNKFGCDFSGWYSFGKITKTVATIRCYILKLKCTKFDLSCGSAADLTRGAYCAPQTSQLDLSGPTSNGKEVKGRA